MKLRKLTQSAVTALFALLMLNSMTTKANAQSVRFDAKDGVGVKIWADGNRLLVDDAGAGFYLIGSNDDTDDGNNIASFVRGNNGIMRTMNGEPTPFLPYSFTFRRDPAASNKLYFDISLGPSPFNFTTVSMPVDGRQERFTHWRYAGSNMLRRFDQNTYRYTAPLPGGPVYINRADGTPKWGEMIGRDYTIRVTVTRSSRPMSLYFVWAPLLSTGVSNVEFSFGPLLFGQRATASGFIQVFRTDPSLFPPLTFQSESHPYHQIGRRDGDGWSVRVTDPPGRFMNYGPYTSGVALGNHQATFRLMLDDVTADNNRILTLDVYDAASGRVLASRNVTRREFSRARRYQDFDLSFIAPANSRLEFRTFWYGGSYVKQDYTRVQ